MQSREQHPVVALRFFDHRRALSGTTRGDLQLWDLESGQGVELLGHRGRITAIHAARETELVVSLDERRHLRVWDLPSLSGKVHLDYAHYEHAFNLLTIRSDGAQAFSVIREGRGCLWDLQQGALLRHVKIDVSQPVIQTRFGQHGQIYLQLEDRRWSCLDLTDESMTHDTRVPEELHAPYQVFIVGDRVILRDSPTGEDLLVLEGHDEPVLSADVSPDGSHVISGDTEGNIRLWRV